MNKPPTNATAMNPTILLPRSSARWARNRKRRPSLRRRADALMKRNPDMPRVDAEWLVRTPWERALLVTAQLLALVILFLAAAAVFIAIASAKL